MTIKQGLSITILSLTMFAASFLLSEESAETHRKQLVIKQGVHVTGPFGTKQASMGGYDLNLIKENVMKLAASDTAWLEKATILSSVSSDFAALPTEEKRKGIRDLTHGELIGFYILESGYRLDVVLGPDHYVGRLAIPLKLVAAVCLVLISIGLYIIISNKLKGTA